MQQTLVDRIKEALAQQAAGIGERFAVHYGEDTALLVAQLRTHLDGERLASLFTALNEFAGTRAEAVPTVEIRDDFAWVAGLMCDDDSTRTVRAGMAESRGLTSADELDPMEIADAEIETAVAASVGVDAFEDVCEWSRYSAALAASRQTPDVLGTYDPQTHHIVIYASAIVHFVRANQATISTLARPLGVDRGGSWFNALAWDVLLHELGHAIHKESAGLMNFERATVELKESFAEALAAGAGRALDGEVSLHGTSKMRCHVIRSVTTLPAEYNFWKVGFAAAGREDECPLMRSHAFLRSFLRQVVEESASVFVGDAGRLDSDPNVALKYGLPPQLGSTWSPTVQLALVGTDPVLEDSATQLWLWYAMNHDEPVSEDDWVKMLWSIAACRHAALCSPSKGPAIQSLLTIALVGLGQMKRSRFSEHWFNLCAGDTSPLIHVVAKRTGLPVEIRHFSR
jgi:hypothetical protein